MWGKRTLTQVVRSVIVGAAVVGAFAGGVVVGVGGQSTSGGGQGAAPKPSAAAASHAADSTDPVAEARAAIEAQASTHRSTSALDASWLCSQSDGDVLVASVLPNSPAVKGGVVAGAQLLSVGGHPARGVPLASVASALRGPAGSSVSVTTRSAAGVLTTSTLIRGEVADNDSTVQRISGGIVLARVAAFSKGVAASLKAGLATIRRTGQIQGIILDLRGNPGGLLTEGVGVAGQFLSGGRVVSYQQTGQPDQVLTAPKGGDTSTPLAVLVDGGTASAAEVVAGALQDRHRGLLLGSKTFGKGSVQQPVYLSDGSTIEFTVGTYRTPSGRSLNNVGLTPDIAVSPVVAAGSADDPVLAEAKTIVGALLADAGASSGTGRG